jgi:hypothetical protein
MRGSVEVWEDNIEHNIRSRFFDSSVFLPEDADDTNAMNAMNHCLMYTLGTGRYGYLAGLKFNISFKQPSY